MSGPFGSHNFMSKGTPPEGGQSLRFNDDDSAYLSWTPASAGDQQTQTISFWIKRANLGTYQYIFAADATAGGRYSMIRFNTSDQLEVYSGNFDSGTQIIQLLTTQVFRDVSAWYHIVVAIDITNATSTDRARLYVNGERVTSFSGTITYPSTTNEVYYSSTRTHWIGQSGASSYYCDMYLSEFNFIDGQALDPTSFGETNANGQWVPIKEPSVTYGTNGFYLPFTNDYEVEGFNTVTYTGNGGDHYIGGVGFEPDFVWVKDRDTGSSHRLHDSVRGAGLKLSSDSTAAESDESSSFTAFNADGFSLAGSAGAYNTSGRKYVAWCWDAGTGSPVSNTDGTLTSTVKANPDYGFSVVTWTSGGSTSDTIGHGLNATPKVVIYKKRDTTANWNYYTTQLDGSIDRFLFTTGTKTDVSLPAFTSTTFQNESGSTDDFVAYCFAEVSGYSSFGSYSGNGSSTGPTVTTGFKPAFVMIKRTDYTAGWIMFDNTRTPYNSLDKYLRADSSAAEVNSSSYEIDFNSNGFQLKGTGNDINNSSGTYIYMAFADKREAAFWLDQSGNNNDWTNNNMQESDISLDSPTNNFCTLSSIDAYPLSTGYISLSEGNLKCNGGPTTGYVNCGSTFYQNSGKWYVEWMIQSRSAASGRTGVGLITQDTNHNGYIGQYDEGVFYADNGLIYYNSGSSYNTGTTYGIGDVIGYAVDFDAGTLAIYKNNTLVYTYTSFTAGTYYTFGAHGYNSSDNNVVNFGQDSSFAGNKVAQGNTDENGFGDFYYEPPAGYLALCTQNLSDPAINDGTEHFNTATWTGTGASNSITGVGFQPDFVWTKCRSVATTAHTLHNVISGVDKYLMSSRTTAESTLATIMTSFDSDGFTLGTSGNANFSGRTFVGWSWKAGGTGVANTDGSISSTVSANPTAGFSIVSYTGNGTAGATVGHGLSQAPDMIICKNRDTSGSWPIYHSANTSAPETDVLFLNSSAATADNNTYWNDAAPTSSVFTVGSFATVNNSGDNLIAYCFHSVEGYSKAGSFTGNGSTDGTFVYTGFRPAFILWKRSSATSNWLIWDDARSPYNVVDKVLFPDIENAESTSAASYGIDFLSNGFKLRNSNATVNGSGSTYIYMAFAESPFKYSNAR